MAAASTPSFDPDTYIRQVLGGFLRAPGDELAPLLERYALDYRFADVPDGELVGWIHQVVNLWERQAQMSTTLGQMCQRLLEADADLRRSSQYGNPRWWRAQITAQRGSGSLPAAADRRATASRASNGHAKPESLESAEIGLPSELPMPTGLTAELSDDGIVLQWSLPLDAPAGLTLTVERSADSATRRIRADSSQVRAEDHEPPAGRQLTYRVVVEHIQHAGLVTSHPLTIVFAPPVGKLNARQLQDGAVTGQWSSHADLWRVRVWRTAEGMPLDQNEGALIQARYDGFDDPLPPAGNHVYSVLPLYRDPSSGAIHEGKRAAVKVSVFAAPPAPELTVQEAAEPADSLISFQWPELPPGMTLMLRRTVAEPPGALGQLMMLDEAERIGQFVAQRLDGTTFAAILPAGCWVVVPFSVAGNRAVRGTSMRVDVIPRIDPLEVVRTGPDVLVSWEWPEGLTLAQVTWVVNETGAPFEVTHNEAQPRGGVPFRRSEAAKVIVRGIVRNGEDVLMSAPTVTNVPAQPPTLTFQVHGVRRFFGLLAWHDRRRVKLVTDLPCTCTHAEVYVHLSGIDQRPDVILHATKGIELGPDHPYEVTVTLPNVSDMDRPYYISCRAWLGDIAVRVNQFGSSGREIR